jgi:hypothetical protein
MASFFQSFASQFGHEPNILPDSICNLCCAWRLSAFVVAEVAPAAAPEWGQKELQGQCWCGKVQYEVRVSRHHSLSSLLCLHRLHFGSH